VTVRRDGVHVTVRRDEFDVHVTVHRDGVHVTVHRDELLTIKPTRCANFSNLFLE
jgi:Rps23 Pro-64 3,4-dihydroxylase Tpa1-like proline 4-hydroxylase